MKFFEDNFPDWLSGVNFKKLVTFNAGFTSTSGPNSLGAITVTSITNSGTETGLQPVVNLTATAAPTAAQSGTLFTLNAAAGFVTTLPAAVPGLTYDFSILTTVTSNSYKIITSAGTVFMQGLITQGATTASVFAANGTSHVAITMTGGAVGGYIGSYFNLTCLSSTLWEITGFNLSASTPTTPFTTS